MRLDLEPWSEPDLRERTRSTKGRSWEIQSMRDWTGCNISSSKLQQAAVLKKKEKKRKSPEPCRFVSKGEKSAVRSNRPLILVSCIKGTILLGRYVGEQAPLIFIHCLSYAFYQCIHTSLRKWSQNTLYKLLFLIADRGQSPCALVLSCLSEELQHPVSSTRLPRLS